ncbi:MAG: BamA/TamA family outer membrane protein [Elusimicrobia bacterium]|nr:BamA/TamA family outer membrane protein [Elusimicrobiota bacterium]
MTRILAFCLVLAAAPALAVPPYSPQAIEKPPTEEPLPMFLRVLVNRTGSGLFLRLPILDLDPNTGVTVGLTPVWVQTSSVTIRFIHAVPVFYNTYAGVTAGYHLIQYVSKGSTLHFHGSLSQKFDRDAGVEFDTDHLDPVTLAGRPLGLNVKFAFSKNSTLRFFGVGAGSHRRDQTNYTLDSINYRISLRAPLTVGSPWSVKLTQALQANDVSHGAVESLPELIDRYPEIALQVTRRRVNADLRGHLIYDTRDSGVTTTSGAYAEAFIGAGDMRVERDQSYYRYGAEVRRFLPGGRGKDGEPNFITAGYVKYEHLVGDVPFWLRPQMGGRYLHRGYGAGRFVDQGVVVFGAEERFHMGTIPGKRMPVSVWLDPFIGCGTVFRRPDLMRLKYLRPVYGVGLRLISRPQLVTSAEVGIGQEGPKVFLDVNYSF